MSLTIITLVIISSFSGMNVKASGIYIITDTPKGTYDNLENLQCTLPNGKLVMAYISKNIGTSGTTITIKVFNVDGSFYSSADYTYDVTYVWFRIGVHAISNTVVYIYGGCKKTGYNNIYFAVIKLNPSTMAETIILSTPFNAPNDPACSGFVSTLLLYNLKYYYICELSVNYGGTFYNYIKLLEYTPDTTLTVTNIYVGSGIASNKLTPAWWFQSPIDPIYAYVMYQTDATPLSYYTISLSGKTSTLIAQCYDTSKAPIPSNFALCNFIKGNVIVNGTDQYLYFSWIYPEMIAGTPAFVYINDRMWFNGTIDTAHFQTHISFAYNMHTEFYGVTLNCWNYEFEYNKSTVYIYFPYKFESGYVRIEKVTLIAHDWFDPNLAGWSVSFDYFPTDNVPNKTGYGDLQYPLYFDFSSQYGMGIANSNSEIWVFSGLSAGVSIYMATVTYIPLDTPNLYANKQYTFTVSATINSLPSSGLYVRFLLNGREQSYKVTNDMGKVTYLVTFIQAGNYLLTWEIYDPSVDSTLLQYTLSDYFNVSVSTGGGVTPPIIITGWTNLLIMWIPVLVFIVTPMLGLAVVGGKYAGGIGMAIGMLGGGFAGIIGGTQLNLLPSYYLWLYLLFMGIALALAVTIGRSGGGSSG